MANIFTLEKFNDFSEKINIDELYEKKRQNDVNKLELFRKILNRIHVRIKTTAAQAKEKYCWFVVPEVIIGVPRYDQAACIAYIMDTLKTNGFLVRYFHPNTILISWSHWVPSYVRTEIKKKTGINLNEYGEQVINEENDDINEHPDMNLGNHKNENANTNTTGIFETLQLTQIYYPTKQMLRVFFYSLIK